MWCTQNQVISILIFLLSYGAIYGFFFYYFVTLLNNDNSDNTVLVVCLGLLSLSVVITSSMGMYLLYTQMKLQRYVIADVDQQVSENSSQHLLSYTNL